MRKGRLLSESERAHASAPRSSAGVAPTAVAPTAVAPTAVAPTAVAENASTDAPPDEPSGTLEEDLERYASEFYHKRDLNAGKKLLAEVVGVFALGGVLLTALTSWLPPLGLTVGSGTIVFVMSKAAELYAELDTEKRKQVRAVVSWIRGGFSLGEQLEDD